MSSHEREPVPSSLDSENEHFHLAESLISWMEYFKTNREDDPDKALSSILSDLTRCVSKLNDDLEIELTILPQCLKNLPWSSMLVTPDLIEDLAFLAQIQSHDLSDIVTHIMLQLKTGDLLASLKQESEHNLDNAVFSRSVERLVDIIVAQCHQLVDIQFIEDYLGFVDTNSIPRIASVMLARSDFRNTRSDELLFKLLKGICISRNCADKFVDAVEDQVDRREESLTFDSFERAVIYAQFVSDYLVDLARRIPNAAQENSEKDLCRIIDNVLLDVEPVLQSGQLSMEQKKILFATMLKCCNCDVLDDNSRLLLAGLFAESDSIKKRPKMIVDMLHSTVQFLRDSKILVNMIEILVDLYFSITGHCEAAHQHFHLSAVRADHYLDSCIEETCPMALMIYYESQLSQSVPQSPIECTKTSTKQSKANIGSNHVREIWPGYLYWLSRLINRLVGRSPGVTPISASAHKMTTILIRLLTRFEGDLDGFLLSDHIPVSDGELDQTRFNYVGLDELVSGYDLSTIEQRLEQNQLSTHNNSLVISSTRYPSNSTPRPVVIDLPSEHKCLLVFIEQLILFYDSINSVGLWSYLKSSHKNEQAIKVSVTSLAVACFLANRSLVNVSSISALSPHLEILGEELVKLRQKALNKLETARKLKSPLDCSQFVDSFIESVQQNSKVQYGDVVQLMATFLRL